MNRPAYPVPADLDDPLIRRMFDYWMGKFHGRCLPSRRDIDPVEIPQLLGHINIIAVIRTPQAMRFQYRLWGTKVTELYGRDYTGRFLDDVISPARLDEIRSVFEAVVATKEPHFWQTPVPAENRDFVSNRRLLLPLSSDGVFVDNLLGFMIGDRKK